MFEAFLWGLGAASSLLIGTWLAQHITIPKRLLGLVMAFGVGVLISAVSFELVEEAFTNYGQKGGGWAVAAGLLAGALVFFIGDTVIDKLGGEHRKRSNGKQRHGSGLAIFFGTVLDGIPESIVLGLTMVTGGAVSAAVVAAVFLSNLPEAIAATTGLKTGGWRRRSITGLWVVVTVISGLAAWAGFSLFDTAAPGTIAFMLAFAGGALLTMLADTMMPEAFEDSGKLVGFITTIGFGLAFALSVLD